MSPVPQSSPESSPESSPPNRDGLPEGDNATTLCDLVQVSSADTKVAGVFVRSVFVSNHGFQGTLYKMGEHCLVSNTGEQTMAIRFVLSLLSNFMDHIINS